MVGILKPVSALLLAFAPAACCIYGAWGLVVQVANYEDPGWGNPPPAFQVNDIVTFLAEERFYEADCHEPADPSDVEPCPPRMPIR